MQRTRLRRALATVALVLAIAAAPIAARAGQFGQGSIGKALKLGKKVVARPRLTPEDEVRMAQEQSKKFDAAHKAWADPLLDAYITGIVQKIVAVAKPTPYTYRVRVVNDASLNAFTFGGGLLYIHVGLIARLENEAQLAMVLGHEIAHVTEGHVAAGIEHAYMTSLIGDAAVTAGGAAGVPVSGRTLDLAYGVTMNAAVNGHGRNQERDADRIGLDYMVKAGYDPREAPITFELLLAEYGDRSSVANFFYGSHPANQERFDTLSSLARTKYGADRAEKRLLVNTEDFKRATRGAVVASGRFEYERNHFATAKALFDKAERAAQDDPVPHYYLAKIAIETAGVDALAGAIAELEAALKADPNYAPAHRELGLAYYRQGDRARAIASLEKYLAADPKAKDAAEIAATIAELKRYGGEP